MRTLEKILAEIKEPDGTMREAARRHWDSLAKPLGSLGRLEDAVTQIAVLTGTLNVRLDKRALLVLCADNGVVAKGVTQTDSSVTAIVARALASGESTVCHMARVAHCDVIPVDMGIVDFEGCSGVLEHRVRNGTADITEGPAMTRKECIRAIEAGVELAEQLSNEQVSIIATGEMGIGNTTTSSAVTSVLLGLEPELVTGRGAGLSDAGLQRKRAAIEEAIKRNHPNANDPLDVLSKVGGLDLAGLCGVFLGGALFHVPVLIDGLISAVAALCAVRLCPEARCAILASHVSAEPAGQKVLDALGVKPLITAGMRLGEGSGAVAALPLLDMALAVYHSGQTFDHLGMEAYTPQ